MLDTLYGNFAMTFILVGCSYVATWPLETLKNLAQTGIPYPNASVMERVRHMGGPAGLLRGVYPGALGGGLRNAFGMVAMIHAQRMVTVMGLRENGES